MRATHRHLRGVSSSWMRASGLWRRRGPFGGRQEPQAVAPEFALRVQMNSRKPPVIHGKYGVSQKPEGAGQASHRISFTRLLTSGTIELNGKSYAVEGTAWMDHEFFTEQVDATLRGWDWVSLQVDNNTELMLYHFRQKDGSAGPFSAGTHIDASGRTTFLSFADLAMQPVGETYSSPATHAAYPTMWHVSVPALRLDLQLSTPLKSQELVSGLGVGLSYWEGAITISGTRDGRSASGVGYLEMTGYATWSYSAAREVVLRP